MESLTIACQRRIVNGRPAENVRFMVYFVRSRWSSKNYVAWLCGGSIVHPRFILTAAACVLDVQNIYAIAGYKKYVNADRIDMDECTKRIKKKIISYCYEKAYQLHPRQNDWWNWENVAMAKVETPYNFHDEIFLQYCSYKPTLIQVNFNKDFESPGRDVITLGWGSSQYYRPVNNNIDLNEEYLLYGSSIILTKDECRPPYKFSGARFENHITRHWICIMKLYGRLDLDGNIVRTFANMSLTSCEDRQALRGQAVTNKCVDKYGFRRFGYFNASDTNDTLEILPTRRAGICQNDHGGPLITWIGGRPYVIGVATAFLVDKHMRCRGPYIFTSTHCNSRLIHCILRAQRTWWWQMSRRSSYCGPDAYVEKYVKWEH